MSWKDEKRTIFWPEWTSGGLDLARDQVSLRVFDNFESPSTTASIQADWIETLCTATRETTSPLNGEGSMKVVVAGGAGSLYKLLDRALFGYPFPGHNGIRFRYIKFRATCDTGIETIRVQLENTAGSIYRYWEIDVAQSIYTEHVIDLDENNEESFPTFAGSGGTWDPEVIDRISFANLSDGRTFYFDDLELLYEYSLVDIIGFPTEASVEIGDIGSLHARINGLWANVKALEGQTQQYAKQGIAVAEIGQACQWALELNSEFAPPTTTEIVPGNYQIDRIRAAATTTIVASTPASESVGTIYASYTVTETDWDTGDLAKVTFSSGYVRTDVGTPELLTATVTAGGTTVTVDNAYEWEVGWLVRIYDDDSGSEWHTIASIDSPTTFTIDATTAEFTVAQNGGIVRSIRTDLSTAIFFTMIQEEAASYRILARGTFTTSSATVPADTSRSEADNTFNGCLLMPVAGTYADVPRRIVDFANTGGVFTINGDLPFPGASGTVEYVILGDQDLSEYILGADNANNAIDTTNVAGQVNGSVLERIEAIQAGLGIVAAAGTGFEEDGTGATLFDSLIAVQGLSTGAGDTTTLADTGRTEANDYWIGSYLLMLSGADAGLVRPIVDSVQNTSVIVYPAFPNATGNASVYAIITQNKETVPAANSASNYWMEDVVGNKTDAASVTASTKSIVAILRGIQTALNITPTGTGTGLEDDGVPNLVTALGTDGATVTDLATSVLGAIGADNATNAFSSSSVTADPDGSVLEREEYVQTQLSYGVLEIEADAGSTTTDIIDAAALTQTNASWWKGALLVSINGDLEGQARPIVAFNIGTDTVTVYPAFTAAPTPGDDFLLISSWRPNVWHQMPDVPVTINAILASETDVFDLTVSGFSYMVDSLRLKSVDPGAETITVRLYELINDVETAVDTFTITTDNYTSHFSLMDMFGMQHLTGDNLRVTVQATAAGPFAITGQYHYGLTYTG